MSSWDGLGVVEVGEEERVEAAGEGAHEAAADLLDVLPSAVRCLT